MFNISTPTNVGILFNLFFKILYRITKKCFYRSSKENHFNI